MDYQTAVSHWAVKQNFTMRYGFNTATYNHLHGGTTKKNTDACRLDPASVSAVTFESLEGGGCETCSYTYMAATFTASCMCGKHKNVALEVDLDYKDLSTILEEVLASEPYVIQTLP